MRTAVLPLSLQRPTRPRLFALGGGARGLGDSGYNLSQPAFKQANAAITATLQSEGGDTAGATAALSNAVDTLLPTLDPTAYSYSDIVSMAQTYVGAAYSIGGAVEHVSQLLSAASGGDPVNGFRIFTGTMVGLVGQLGSLAAVAGATLPGIGTAIAAGAELVGALVTALAGPSQPQFSVGGCSYTSSCQPTIVAGCTASCDAQQWPSGSPFWRHFPKKTGGNENDSQWYDGSSSIRWSGSSSGPMGTWFGPPSAAGWVPVSVQQTNVGYRLIDVAFPDWHYLACNSEVPVVYGRTFQPITGAKIPLSSSDSAALLAFSQAFTQAWMANKEFELNGMKSQPDWLVFLHLVRVWNRAHDGSSVIDVPQLPKQPLAPPYVVRDPQHPISGGQIVGACPAYLSPFYQSLVTQAIGNGPVNRPSDPAYAGNSTAIRIHLGPLLKPKTTITMHLGAFAKKPGLNPAQTGALAVVGTVAAVAAGGSLYAFLTNQGISYFWGKVFDGVVDGVKGILPK